MEELESTGLFFPHFSILTRESSKELLFIHDRMPVILDAESAATWISPAADLDTVKAIAGKALTRMVFEKKRRKKEVKMFH